MLTNSGLEIPEIKLIDFVIMQLMNELWSPLAKLSVTVVRAAYGTTPGRD
jgi:hypothetical protein